MYGMSYLFSVQINLIVLFIDCKLNIYINEMTRSHVRNIDVKCIEGGC